MQLVDLTLDTPAENVALDEALLDAAESAFGESERGACSEVLRLWEPREMMVVAGNSSRLADEVNLDACARHGVPIFRRASGGATIFTGPGCLMYAVVLSYHLRPQLRSINSAHQLVLDTIAIALNGVLGAALPPLPLGEGRGEGAVLPPTAYRPLPTVAARAGISDLVLGDKKFSGNSLRCKRSHFLYHGTLLYRFPLDQIGKFLKIPARQPAYRARRSHADFVTNLPLDAAALRQSLITAFCATEKYPNWPRALTANLVAEKYTRPAWNQRL
jgi:lipoate-protein ligase A